jgi:hypothetical protein
MFEEIKYRKNSNSKQGVNTPKNLFFLRIWKLQRSQKDYDNILLFKAIKCRDTGDMSPTIP